MLLSGAMRAKKVTPQNCAIRIVPTMPWRLAEVEPLEAYRLKVRFLDGTSGEVDMSHLIFSKRAGVFAALKDPDLFNQVHLEYGVATWPGEIDLAPDTMYEAIKKQHRWIID